MSTKLRVAIQGALIVLAGWWVYSPVFHGGWLSDDKIEVTGNADLREPGGLVQIWVGADSRDYFPLKSTVQWVQWRLWQDQVAGYHLTNVALHLLSAFLIWRLLRKLGVRLAWLGGLLFAIHPLAVESVAWIAELKNCLSLPPLLLAACAYVDYDQDRRRGRYAASVAWFLTAVLCKSSVVMFPAAIAVYIWWRRGSLRWADLRAIAPFAVISAGFGLTAIWFQQHRAIGVAAHGAAGLGARLAAGGLAAAFYLWKSAVPTGLMFCYPRWPVDPPRLWQFIPWVAVLAAAGWLAVKRGDPGPAWRRHALLGLGWFFLNLLPVLGFIPMSYQMRYSWVADHFAYISLVATVGLAAAAIGWVPVGSDRPAAARAALLAAVAAIGLWLGLSAHRYAGKFCDEDTLWTYTHQLNPGAWSAETEARRLMVSGNSLLARGKTGEAAAEFEAALKLNPQYAQAHNNLGKVFFQEGRLDEAMSHFAAALSLDPQLPEAHNNLGAVLEKLPGKLPEAILEFEEAVRLDPGDAGNRHNLGMALAQFGRLDEAIPQLVAALRIKPDFADAHNSLGIALAQSGRLPDALAEFAAAARLDPRLVPARKNLTFALAGLRRTDEAVDSCAEWVRLAPDDPDARQAMDTLLRAAGRTEASRPQPPPRP